MEVAMSEQDQSEPKRMSRRQALSMLGLAATVGYAVPSILTVSDAEAGAVVIRRSPRRPRAPNSRCCYPWPYGRAGARAHAGGRSRAHAPSRGSAYDRFQADHRV